MDSTVEKSQASQTRRKRHTPRRHRSSSGSKRRVADYLEKTLQVALVLLLITLPLPMGGLDRWAWSSAGLVLFALLALWLLIAVLKGRIRIPKTGVWAIFALVIGVGLLQILPLDGLVESLSPKAWTVWGQAQDLGAQVNAVTISLLPVETREHLWLIAALALGFGLVMYSFRTEKSLFVLALAIMAAATINAAVGMAQYFSDTNWVLWMYRTFHLQALAGTFRNKNHFAFLLNMALLVGMGTFLAIVFARKKSTSRRHQRHRSLNEILLEYRFGLETLLGLFLVFTLVALLFSYSRAGIVCGFGTIMAFLIYSWWLRRGSWHVALLAGLAGLALLMVSFYSLNPLLDKLESVAAGGDSSYLARLDIWDSAWQLIKNFPLLGIGIGAFRYVSPINEDGILIDKLAFYAHNDWLETFALLGIPVAIVVVGLSLFILIKLIRRLRSPRTVTGWLGLGAVFALIAAAAHELFDFNLQMPGNALLFLAVLALALRASQLSSQDKDKEDQVANDWVVPLDLKGKGACAVITVAVMAVGMWGLYPIAAGGWAHARIMQRLDINAPPSILSEEEQANYLAKRSQKVLDQTPDNFTALVTLADQENNLAVIQYKERLAKLISKRLGYPVEPQEAFEPQFDDLRYQITGQMTQEERGPIEERLQLARDLYARAAGLAPTNGHLFAVLARARERAGVWSGYDRQLVLADYDAAHRLYPMQGTVTMLCAEGYWREYQHLLRNNQSDEAKVVLNRAMGLFKDAIDQTPVLARYVYDSLWEQFHDFNQLKELTPDTLGAQRILFSFLYAQSQWSFCLPINERIIALNKARPEEISPESVGLREYVRRVRQSKEEVAFQSLRNRVTILGALAKWGERKKAMHEQRQASKDYLAPQLQQAQEWTEARKYNRSRAELDQILAVDPFWPQAIVAQAENLNWLGESRQALELLLRLTYMKEPIEDKELQAAVVLTQKSGENYQLLIGPKDFPLHKAIYAGLLVRQQKAAAALDVLDELQMQLKAGQRNEWSQEHLLPYFAGQAYELMKQPMLAGKSYLATLKICPTHLDAGRRLLKIIDGIGRDDFLSTVGPDEACRAKEVVTVIDGVLSAISALPEINQIFDSILRLVTYEVDPEAVNPGEQVQCEYFWENIGLAEGFEPVIVNRYFLNSLIEFWDGYALAEKNTISNLRIGELIKVDRIISPIDKIAGQLRRMLQPGKYFVEIRPKLRLDLGQNSRANSITVVFSIFKINPYSLK